MFGPNPKKDADLKEVIEANEDLTNDQREFIADLAITMLYSAKNPVGSFESGVKSARKLFNDRQAFINGKMPEELSIAS